MKNNIPNIIAGHGRTQLFTDKRVRKEYVINKLNGEAMRNSLDYITSLYNNAPDPIKFRPGGVQGPAGYAYSSGTLAKMLSEKKFNYRDNKAVVIFFNNEAKAQHTINLLRRDSDFAKTFIFAIGNDDPKRLDDLRGVMVPDGNSFLIQETSNSDFIRFNMALQCLQRFNQCYICFQPIPNLTEFKTCKELTSNDFFFYYTRSDFINRGFTKVVEPYQKIVASWKAQTRIEAQPEMTKLQKITFVVPTRINAYRSDCALKTVIGSLRNQLYPDVEIIISEHDSEIKFNPQTYNPVKHIFTEDKHRGFFNKCEAMNAAAVQCHNENIIFHDGDILVDNTYALQCERILKDYDACHLLDFLYYLDEGSTQILSRGTIDINLLKLQKVRRYVEGGSIACRKSAYLEVGGFYEGFAGYGCEDSEFMDRIYLKNFYNKRFVNGFHLFHNHAPETQTQNTTTHQMWNNFKAQYTLANRAKQFRKELGEKYGI